MNLHKPVIVIAVVLAVSSIHAQNLETVKVVSQKVDRTVRLPGEFTAYQRVSIYARVASFVDDVHVDRGSVVKRGQLLVTLIAPELAAQAAESEARAQAVLLQLAEAEAKLVAARTNADMLKAASKTEGAVSQAEVINSEQALQGAMAVKNAVENTAKAARSAADAVKQLFSYLQVRAPFEGVVTERFVQIEQNTRLRLVVAVPEAHVAGVVKGASVTFTVPAHPGQTFHAAVARSAQSLDTRTRSMMVELDVTNPGGQLATGMYADVIWPVRRPTASLLVPATAVVTNTERTFVIRANAGKAEWVDVRRGSTVGAMVEVYGDLREGDVIVRRGNDEIREGTSLSGGRPTGA
jgi:membrane fusion protein (multidrug efflux system)